MPWNSINAVDPAWYSSAEEENAEGHSRSALRDILHIGCRTVFRFWENTLREGNVSCRDIDARAIPGIVPWIGVLEHDEALSAYRWRTAGPGLSRLLPGEVTGNVFAGGWPDFERRTILQALCRVTGRLQPFVARLKAASRFPGPVGIELLALPVQPGEGASIQALCGIFPFSQPDWLGRAAIVNMELMSLRAIRIGSGPRSAVAAPQWPARQPVGLRVIRGGLAD